MQEHSRQGDVSGDLRREINALSGLLQFSIERGYPEQLRVALQAMMKARLQRLETRPETALGYSV